MKVPAAARAGLSGCSLRSPVSLIINTQGGRPPVTPKVLDLVA